jgi:hypothetical protein
VGCLESDVSINRSLEIPGSYPNVQDNLVLLLLALIHIVREFIILCEFFVLDVFEHDWLYFNRLFETSRSLQNTRLDIVGLRQAVRLLDYAIAKVLNIIERLDEVTKLPRVNMTLRGI